MFFHCYYIIYEDLESYNIRDFNDLSCTITATLSTGEEILNQKIIVERDAFSKYE